MVGKMGHRFVTQDAMGDVLVAGMEQDIDADDHVLKEAKSCPLMSKWVGKSGIETWQRRQPQSLLNPR